MDPLQQAAEQLLRAADLMHQVEEQRYDQVQAAQGAGWEALGQRANLYEQRTALRGQVSLFGTPAGQVLAQQQAGLASGNAVLATRAQVAQSRAQLAHMDTPQGQAETLQQARLQAEQAGLQNQVRARQQSARAAVETERNIQVYGQLGAAAISVAGAFGKMAPVVGAVTAAWSKITGLVGFANPNTAATYQGSVNLLKAQIGSFFTPMVDAVSHNIQRISRDIGSIPSPIREGVRSGLGQIADTATRPVTSGGYLGALLEHTRYLGPRAASYLGFDEQAIVQRRERFGQAVTGWTEQHLPSWLASPFNTLMRAGTGARAPGAARDELMRSGQGLLAPSAGTGQDYYRQSQMAVLAQGPLESAQLEIQLRNIAEILELKLTQIADSTAGMPDMSSFR